MRNMVFAVLICSAAVFLSACGEQENNTQSTVKKTVRETAEAVDKTADHATGKAQLERKKKLENKLNSLQKNQQNQLDQALKD